MLVLLLLPCGFIFTIYKCHKCCVALPHGAMDWSVVCDCGIS